MSTAFLILAGFYHYYLHEGTPPGTTPRLSGNLHGPPGGSHERLQRVPGTFQGSQGLPYPPPELQGTSQGPPRKSPSAPSDLRPLGSPREPPGHPKTSQKPPQGAPSVPSDPKNPRKGPRSRARAPSGTTQGTSQEQQMSPQEHLTTPPGSSQGPPRRPRHPSGSPHRPVRNSPRLSKRLQGLRPLDILGLFPLPRTLHMNFNGFLW